MAPVPPARLLDLTRLLSRLGRGVLTGVDRVELAYLERLLADPLPLFALVRTRLGFLLLDRAGAQAVTHWALNAPQTARTTRDLRPVALARCLRPFLGGMLRRHLPEGLSYLNVGHANLSKQVMRAIRHVPGARIAVLVHDVIPLDHPEFTRVGIPEVFARKMAAVANHADLVICSTQDAKLHVQTQFARIGRVPPFVVAGLGVPVPQPDPTALPPDLDLTPPYFVALGTIEPRKNHALLLDVWQDLPPPARLFIVGGRGWADAATFARIEAAEANGRVQMLCGLPDAAVVALLQGAEALLFPSLAEGYGLPAVEAAALGVPVICSDLAVFREVMGNYPVYLDPADSYSWMETIAQTIAQSNGEQAGRSQTKPKEKKAAPNWAAHFNLVLSLA